MEKKRPMGVIVLGVIEILTGLFYCAMPLLWGMKLELNLFFLFSLLAIIAGIGVIMLKNWARILYIIVAVANILGTAYYISGRAKLTLLDILLQVFRTNNIIAVISLIYFFDFKISLIFSAIPALSSLYFFSKSFGSPLSQNLS